MSAISLTFGDVAENHKGMQKIGRMSDKGYCLNDLLVARQWFECRGCVCQLISLHEGFGGEIEFAPENHAWILIVKRAVDAMLGENGAELLLREQNGLVKDTKAFMYGRVVNKHARHNLCFADIHQEPNYESGMGTIYAFSEVPVLNRIRETFDRIIPNTESGLLQAEGNYYYNVKKCGIGYHGDAERKKVVAMRLGESIPLCFRWYHRHHQVGPTKVIDVLEHGDMYMMSEKTTGFDWKSQSKYTLRHAAGCDKYVK